MLDVRLLGQFTVQRNGQTVEIPSRPAQALLAYLLLNPRVKTRREKLAGLLWPESSDDHARAYLRQTLWLLRKHVGDEYFLADKIAVGLNPEADYTLDVDRLTNASASLTTDGLMGALAAYGGELLPGFYDDWVAPERERLQVVAGKQFGELIERLLHERRWPEVLEWGERWLAADESAEPAYQALLKAYGALRDTARASAVYQRCLAALERSLGVGPADETKALYEAVMRAEWSPRPPSSPYRGLQAFREQDAPYFFGRESFTLRLLEMVNRKPLVAVLGASGSGKSSVVLAGLLPRLRATSGWQMAVVRPGADPQHSLEMGLAQLRGPHHAERPIVSMRALLDDGQIERRLLVIDQFEELYTLCPRPEIQRTFIDALLEPARHFQQTQTSTVVCVLTLRADFLGLALAYRPFADALQEASLILSPMNRDELALAIERPAAAQGVDFEPGLAERILDDVGADGSHPPEPGNLPLLEFALQQLWEREPSRLLMHTAYEAIGRAPGALGRYADEVYAGLSESEQALARRVFVQMVQPGQHTGDTRRLALRSELGDAALNLAQTLADKRLLVTGRDPGGRETAELAHEALIHAWGQLRGWMDLDRAFRAWQERLRAALRQWEAAKRDEGALLRGVPLAEAQGWLRDREADLGPAEREFIRASVTLQRRQEAEREWRRRRTVAGLAMGLMVAITLALLTGLSWLESRRDERAALEAYSVSLAAHAQAALDDLDPATALALALAANNIESPPALARRLLLEAAYAPNARARYHRPTRS